HTITAASVGLRAPRERPIASARPSGRAVRTSRGAAFIDILSLVSEPATVCPAAGSGKRLTSLGRTAKSSGRVRSRRPKEQRDRARHGRRTERRDRRRLWSLYRRLPVCRPGALWLAAAQCPGGRTS